MLPNSQGLFFFFWRVDFPVCHCPLPLTYTWRISANVQENFIRILTHCGHKMTIHKVRKGGILYLKHHQNIVWGSSLVAQWVKELALSLLWLGFDPWLRNFCVLQAWQKKKKKKKDSLGTGLYLTCNLHDYPFKAPPNKYWPFKPQVCFLSKCCFKLTYNPLFLLPTRLLPQVLLSLGKLRSHPCSQHRYVQLQMKLFILGLLWLQWL